MATEIAKAYIQIVPSMKGIKGSIQNSLGEESDSAGKFAGNKIVSGIKGAIAVAGIGAALGTALTEGAALEQSLGGIETLFKESADSVKKNAAEAYRTAGMSANQYMELTTSFAASLLSRLGGDTQKAAEISDMAMTDMSDNANKMGTDMERITDAYQGFAKQNYTMLDNLKLGYGGTKTEMERLLSDAEKLTGVHYDINNLSDVYSAIHAIQGQLGITGTTAKEAASTLSGSFASMKAAFQNVLGELTLGMDIGPSLNALATTVTTFLTGNLLPAVWNILSALPGALVTFIQALAPQLLPAFSALVGQISSGFASGDRILVMANNMITSLGNGIMENAPLLFHQMWLLIYQMEDAIKQQLPTILQQGSDIILNITNGILQNLPYFISVGSQILREFILTVSSSLPTILQKGSELLLNLVNGIINNLPQITAAGAQAIARLATAIGQNLPQILQSGIEIIGKLAAGLIKAIPDLVGKIPQIISSIKDAFSKTDWLSVGKNIISGIANGLKNAGSELWSAVKGVLGSFKDNVLSFFGINSPSKWGAWVGEMIDLGMANGLTNNQNAIARAVKSVQDTMSSPFDNDFAYSIRGTSTYMAVTSESYVNDKIDALMSLIASRRDEKQEITIRLKDREVARALVEMGVAFQ